MKKKQGVIFFVGFSLVRSIYAGGNAAGEGETAFADDVNIKYGQEKGVYADGKGIYNDGIDISIDVKGIYANG